MTFFYFYIKKRMPLPPLICIGKILPVLAIRELIITGINIFKHYAGENAMPLVMPERAVFVITEVIIIWILIQWFSSYTGKKTFFPAFITIGMLFILLVGADSSLNLIAWIPFLGQIYIHIIFLGIYIFLAAILYAVSEYNTANPTHIINTRTGIVQATIVFHSFAIFVFGFFNPSYNDVFIKNIFSRFITCFI